MRNILVTIGLLLALSSIISGSCVWYLTCFNDAGGCTLAGHCNSVKTPGANQSRCYTNTATNKCCVCVYRVNECTDGSYERIIDYQVAVNNSSCTVVPPSDHCGHNCIGWSPPGGSG